MGADDQFSLFVQRKKRLLDKEVASLKNPKARVAKMSQKMEDFQRMKMDRKQYRRALEKE